MSRKRTRIHQLPRRTVAESVSAPARESVSVETGIVEATKQSGRMLVRLIQAGWSLNGSYYPSAALKRDGAAAWPKGTQSFIDHASPAEDEERPVGSVAKLAAIQTEDARWDEETHSLVAWVQLFAPWRDPLMEMWDVERREGVKAVGLSIRAWVTGEQGEAEGRQGFIVDSILEGRSVDFVTKPAAGGAILAAIEAVQAGKVTEARSVGTFLESRLHLALTEFADSMYGDGRLTRPERIVLSSAIGDGLQAWTARVEKDAPQLFKRSPYEDAPDGEVAADEALSDDTRSRLQRAIKAAHGKDDVEEYGGLWVHDFDPDESYVIYSNDSKTWRQPYTTGEDGIALTGEPTEVTRRTTYVPVDTPAAENARVLLPTELLAVTETAAALTRADQALQNSPAPPVTASADGSPSTAPNHPVSEGVSTMSGTTNEGAQPAAGTQNAIPVDEAVAFITSQRDDAVRRCEALTEALTDSRSTERTANAERDAAVARSLLLEGNEAGRIAVDKALADPANGVPESMFASISPRVHAAVRGNVPMKEAKVDADALEAFVVAAITAERTYAASVLESQGYGRPSGLGGSGNEVMSEEAFEQDVAAQLVDLGLDESTANLAAKGR